MMPNTETTRSPDDFAPALAAFTSKLEAMMHAEHARKGYRFEPDVITTEQGPKYVRVICSQRGTDSGRSVYCFVEKATGLILKAKSWKGPEKKNPRGSIYDQDPIAQCGPYGVAYMRGR